MSHPEKSSPAVAAVVPPPFKSERRSRPRLKLSQPVRVRLTDSTSQEEIRSTLDISVDRLHFTTWVEDYQVGMRMQVTFPYSSWEQVNRDYLAEVVRVERLADGRLGVVLHFLNREAS